ncbi:MAG: transcription-repair coupling factor [Tepidisphaerales bacterium]
MSDVDELDSPVQNAEAVLYSEPMRRVVEALVRSGSAVVHGLWGSSVAAVVASVAEGVPGPGERWSPAEPWHHGWWPLKLRSGLLVCGHLDEADDLADDLHLFTGTRPEVLPALELAGSLGHGSEELSANRLLLLHRLLDGGWDGKLVVAPIQALMQSLPGPGQLDDVFRVLRPGLKLEPEKLIVWLSEHGYSRLEQVETPGDFAVRGGIIDIYVPGDHPQSGEEVGLAVRIDFFDDVIESIRRFSLETLGSLDALKEVVVPDIRGKLPEADGSVSLLHYLPERSVLAFWAPLEIAEQARSYLERLPESSGIYPLAALLNIARRGPGGEDRHWYRLELTPFTAASPAVVDPASPEVKLPVRSLQRFETDSRTAMRELLELARTHRVSVICENEGEMGRLGELLRDSERQLDLHEARLVSRIEVAEGYLHRGFVFGDAEQVAEKTSSQSTFADDDNLPVVLVGHHELFNRFDQRRRVRKMIASRPVDSFLDLKVGDYVVHVAHGIARFTGIQTLTRDGKAEEFLTLRFAEDATLHVPATRVNLIQKYIGGFRGTPPLSKLGSGLWEKQKSRVKQAVMDLAAELVEVQAAREKQAGFAFPPDSTWMKEFEAAFPYNPTPDQLAANEEIKADMCRPRPMDRLLCGDVGYGKTELAMRAAFKAAEAGKQVAVLVPTTVLAEQHERSFRQRMGGFPFVVESVSRFKTAGEIRKTLERTRAGEVDILIGTHRLLSDDVVFHDLGLVIIDEEQRFGVRHKERLKKLKKTVDVLTMSATPIPRTLHMSLLGLRDISSLTTAPQDRRSVVTEVMSDDPNRIRLAIQRELQREGQVYFVHNRVQTILAAAERVKTLVPEARILIGHGQMPDDQLEEIMLRFVRHEADILVCTTIIESGLDIPNANTIIIDNADRFGLSELHQLRGRVGRYKHRAYCYLLLPTHRPVTPTAQKRLMAIEEYSHLGAGFKIAMRDLEIRGAGNLLGPEQSGHIATVGYEMYCQILEEATREIRQEQKQITPEAHVDIGVSEVIPKTYIPGDRARLDVYRRISRCTSPEMLAQLRQDTIDAYGDPPRQFDVLIAMAELKLLAGQFGISTVFRQDPDVVLRVRDAARVQKGLAAAPGRVTVLDEKTVYLRMPPVFHEPETLLMTLRNLLKAAWDRERAESPQPSAAATTQDATDTSAPVVSAAKDDGAGGSAAVARQPLSLPESWKHLDEKGRSAGARRVEEAARRAPPPDKPSKSESAPSAGSAAATSSSKGLSVPADPFGRGGSVSSPGPRLSAADRSRAAVEKRTTGGAAQVKAAAKSSGPAPQPVGGPTAIPEYDKLLSLREMGILTDAEFAAAIKRLLERHAQKKA